MWGWGAVPSKLLLGKIWGAILSHIREKPRSSSVQRWHVTAGSAGPARQQHGSDMRRWHGVRGRDYRGEGTVVVKAVDGTCGICNHRYGRAGGGPCENVGQPTTVWSRSEGRAGRDFLSGATWRAVIGCRFKLCVLRLRYYFVSRGL